MHGSSAPLTLRLPFAISVVNNIGSEFNSRFLSARQDASNKPFERTGRHKVHVDFNSVCLPLKGSIRPLAKALI
jgi:hypothetical protein